MEKIELDSPPQDGISGIVFAPSSYNLLCGSWDKTVRLYDTTANKQLQQVHAPAPVLAVCFGSADEHNAISGCVDGAVRACNLTTGHVDTIGSHEGGVRCVSMLQTGSLVSGSWDGTVRLWDVKGQRCVGVHRQADKVYGMAAAGNHLIVATAGRHVWIWDAVPLQRRESGLKYQTRCVSATPDHTGFAIGSIEGRIAVEYINTAPEVQQRKFAFKCHREKTDSGDVIYPVNSIAFHPGFGTFASGGCDGYVNVWDPVNRKRLYQFQKYDTSVASMDFSHDGAKLAIAVSYTMEQGEKEHPPDAIHVRAVDDKQVQPKQK